jgi:hypothetical protein
MIAEIIQPGNVDTIWPQLAEGFTKSCEGTNVSSGWLWTQCRAGEAFLVICHKDNEIKGACVVRFENQPSRLVLRGLALCGSNMSEWLATMQEKVRQMAREGGASVFIDEGRPGLAKMIKEARVVRVIFEVDVT